VGFVSDPSSDVYRLAKDLQVALPLHPEYETGPNVYYIPPFSGPSQVNPDGSLINVERIPVDYLRFLFGSAVDAAIATLRDARANGDPDGILAILSSNDRYDIPVGG
jgi:nitrate reductase beta subunit